jgi:hypothetical protein
MTNAISKRILAFALAVATVIAFTPAIAFTQSASAATRPGKVKWSSITKTPTTITLKWKKASKAKGYSVYQKKSGKYKKIKTTTKRTYTAKKLKAFKSYSFKVRAYKMSGGKKVYGKYSSAKKVTTAASKITGVTITSSASSVSAGSNVTFTATVTGGTKPLKYQWYKDGVLIEGATDSTYTAALSSSDSGAKFTCKVTGPDGKSLTSEEAGSVTVNYVAPALSVSVPDQSAATGSAATFSATASNGLGNYTYQWYQKSIENSGFVKIDGATSSTYSPQTGTTRKVTMHNNGTEYKCVVSDSSSNTASATGKLTVTGATVTNSWNIGNKTGSPVNYNGSNGDDNVVVTLYSDGELAVTGKGDTVLFGNATSPGTDAYKTPWNLAGKTSAITSATIASGVQPTNMGHWYEDCTVLTAAPAIPSSVTNMDSTFQSCESLTAPDLSRCTNLTNMNETFFSCIALTTAPTIPGSVTNMNGTFCNCTALTTAPAIPGSVTHMDHTFGRCIALMTAPTIPSSVAVMTYTFDGCSALTGTMLIKANPGDGYYDNCFLGAATNTGTDLKVYAAGTNVASVKSIVNTKTKGLSTGNSNIEYAVITVGTWNIGGDGTTQYDGSNGTSGVKATLNSEGLLEVTGSGDTVVFSGTAAGEAPWTTNTYKDQITTSTITSTVATTNMSQWYTRCNNLTSAPAIPSSVKNMGSTFYGCTALTTAPTIPSSVENMGSTFQGCTSLTTAPTIPSSVTDMNGTFERCTALTTAPTIPSSVTDMIVTFEYCTALTTAPTIPSSVLYMDSTFAGCSALTGTMQINANPVFYGGCFNLAATNSGTHLTVYGSTSAGNGVTVNAIVNDANNRNITYGGSQ